DAHLNSAKFDTSPCLPGRGGEGNSQLKAEPSLNIRREFATVGASKSMNSTRGETATLPRTSVHSASTENVPRSVYVAVAGLACLPIGLLWDISHHSTIGRDTFWTPAHILIQLGGIVPALLFAAIALKTTFRGTLQTRD